MHVKHFRLVIFKVFFSLLSLRMLYLYQDNRAHTLSRTSKAASIVLFWPEKRQRKGAQETKTFKEKNGSCQITEMSIHTGRILWTDLCLAKYCRLFELEVLPYTATVMAMCLRHPLQLLQITSGPQVILILCEWGFKALYCRNFPS